MRGKGKVPWFFSGDAVLKYPSCQHQ